jgi:hypothetical protein
MKATRKEHHMKLKDALVKDGFLKAGEAGRGRPSKAMIARAKELAAQGWDIDGFTVTVTPKSEAVADKPAEVKHTPKTNGPQAIADVPDPTRFENSTEAFSMVDGKRRPVGMRTVCNNCRSSLTYCPCPSPVVNLDYNLTGVVEFRTKVPTTKEARK